MKIKSLIIAFSLLFCLGLSSSTIGITNVSGIEENDTGLVNEVIENEEVHKATDVTVVQVIY